MPLWLCLTFRLGVFLRCITSIYLPRIITSPPIDYVSYIIVIFLSSPFLTQTPFFFTISLTPSSYFYSSHVVLGHSLIVVCKTAGFCLASLNSIHSTHHFARSCIFLSFLHMLDCEFALSSCRRFALTKITSSRHRSCTVHGIR